MELSTWAELLMLNKLMEKEITLEIIIGEEIKETKTDQTTSKKSVIVFYPKLRWQKNSKKRKNRSSKTLNLKKKNQAKP